MSNPVITNSDTSDILLFNGVFKDFLVTVAIGDVLARGTVIGYEATAEDWIILESDGANGSDIPRGMLMEELDNSDNESAGEFTTSLLIRGEVDSTKIVFDQGTDTLATENTDGVVLSDALITLGIIPVFRSVEDGLDNQ